MAKKVAVFTGARAEYGLLHPLMIKLRRSSEFDLQLIVSGMHLSPRFGETWRVIEQDGFAIDAKVEMLLASDTACGIAKSMGVGTLGFADALERLRPDFLVILGDRFEALAVAQVAAVMRIPIVHLHGGEVTEGAYDDSIRHAITKLAHFHFVSCEAYRRRVIQLGEQPACVWNVGALGLENIRNIPRVPLETINQQLALNLCKPFFLVTYHPVTAADEDPGKTFGNILAALNEFPDHQVLFTYPNSDNGADQLIRLIEQYVTKQPGRAWAIPSLGLARYLSVVQESAAVIGNSSSGIIEVPSLGTTAVNVGVRQKGRLSADSVVHVGTRVADIKSGIQQALTTEAKQRARSAKNPYGEGDTSRKIMEVLCSLDPPDAKVFYDLALIQGGGV
ncbi:UDP-N-acetylglucosamine 2-epimerase [Marinobacter koreensis]|jgi:UDP-N-acetylglucosamine 2-epimerase (non-hydrolysing)|uniref:UDP-N-acetylglucosamine 2-epimerase n=1 Tax=Marinobacter koreensis TaxID=335974 RepID=A0ABW0RID0_9GAMM|nr:UDP-N-acetylglucosamine 2-epimerase [Marinobacter koreensis]MCK7547000.1 UDP-N-acetylglucosamine 2-epimerase [Marinobacter koreensis]